MAGGCAGCQQGPAQPKLDARARRRAGKLGGGFEQRRICGDARSRACIVAARHRAGPRLHDGGRIDQMGLAGCAAVAAAKSRLARGRGSAMAGLKRFAQRNAAWTVQGVVCLLAAVLAMWATGCVLYAMPRESVAELTQWQAAARHACVVVHGIGAWTVCLLAGRWILPHVLAMWRRMYGHRHGWLGLLSMASLTALAASGLFLLYGGESLQAAASSLHWWMGVAWPAALAGHMRR